MKQKSCLHCHGSHSEDDIYCDKTGLPIVPEKITCNVCDGDVNEGDDVCLNCGSIISVSLFGKPEEEIEPLKTSQESVAPTGITPNKPVVDSIEYVKPEAAGAQEVESVKSLSKKNVGLSDTALMKPVKSAGSAKPEAVDVQPAKPAMDAGPAESEKTDVLQETPAASDARLEQIQKLDGIFSQSEKVLKKTYSLLSFVEKKYILIACVIIIFLVGLFNGYAWDGRVYPEARFFSLHFTEVAAAQSMPSATPKASAQQIQSVVVTMTPIPTEIPSCTVPELTGLSSAEAGRKATNLGFQARISEEFNAQIVKGKVVSQQPPANSRLDTCSGEISLVVSLGPQPTEVPSIYTVRMFNVDDSAILYINEVPVMKSEYGQNGIDPNYIDNDAKPGDSGEIDITSLLRQGSNTLRFELWNLQVCCYTSISVEVKKDDVVVFSDELYKSDGSEGYKYNKTFVIEQSSSSGDVSSPASVVGGGQSMVVVPAGSFLMGSEGYFDEEKPVYQVSVDEFWIDKTEVTNAMFQEFVNSTGYVTQAEKLGFSSIYNVDSDSWLNISGANWQHPYGGGSSNVEQELYPVTHVAWNDAKAYCSWAGKRLPTEIEWEYAARGPENRKFPWGDDDPNGTLTNFTDINYLASWSDKSSKDGYKFIAPVGTYQKGASWVGALDMAGNVWEWVDAWYEAYPDNTDWNLLYGTNYKVLRGGSWLYHDYYLRSSYRNRDNPTIINNDHSFRCARGASFGY